MDLTIVKKESSSGYETDIEPSPMPLPRRRKRRERTMFSTADTDRLEAVFETNRYRGIYERERLAFELGYSEDRVHVWFQNRRSKLRKERNNKKPAPLQFNPDIMVPRTDARGPYYPMTSSVVDARSVPSPISVYGSVMKSAVTSQDRLSPQSTPRLSPTPVWTPGGSEGSPEQSPASTHSSPEFMRPWEKQTVLPPACRRDAVIDACLRAPPVSPYPYCTWAVVVDPVTKDVKVVPVPSMFSYLMSPPPITPMLPF